MWSDHIRFVHIHALVDAPGYILAGTPHSLFFITSRWTALSQVFLAQAVGMGVGLGMTFLPSISVVSHHFKAHRALAIGIVATGASAGGIVFPIMLNHLFQNPRMGFTGGVRVSGAVVGVMLLCANALMRTNYPPHSSKPPLTWTIFRRIVWDGAYLWSILGCAFLAWIIIL